VEKKWKGPKTTLLAKLAENYWKSNSKI